MPRIRSFVLNSRLGTHWEWERRSSKKGLQRGELAGAKRHGTKKETQRRSRRHSERAHPKKKKKKKKPQKKKHDTKYHGRAQKLSNSNSGAGGGSGPQNQEGSPLPLGRALDRDKGGRSRAGACRRTKDGLALLKKRMEGGKRGHKEGTPGIYEGGAFARRGSTKPRKDRTTQALG